MCINQLLKDNDYLVENLGSAKQVMIQALLN